MPFFRRVINIMVHGDTDSGEVRAALEDDYHHFRVRLNLHNQRITEAHAEALRTPYTLCKDSVAEITKICQTPILQTAHDITRATDARLQCTHQLDLAGLALATAARGLKSQHYAAEVPRHKLGFTQPRLWRNGTEILHWDVQDNIIKSPAPFCERPLGQGMSSWAIANLDSETAEAAMVLRRCTLISLGRLRNLDLETHAHDWGRCYVQQPERAFDAKRVIGSTLDFSERETDLCATDQEWLHQSTI
ncbi:DUF2889 domain-containing protein [Aestuariicella hydrocarbonica]|uniref:DUF2889 domain-containing protein n=1 Tax=Pseudomaricurvus hydrocarbonicus TaxID=1470433 RepID=A0A9E5JWB6_9GAMM|nr:DUF2889 domain-containing protein [Aestuariicella hydrocarbonica]NHO66691.1 DUF2889 domain-containing protein [Aestuariicella hydrocarbonica]